MAEQRIYKVERGDTLEKISEKTGFYMEEIRQWHNLRCENVKDLIEYGGRLPKEILLPMHAPKTFYKNIEPNPHEKLVMRTPEENERIFLENLVFDKQARYRCEQFNATKVEENTTFHCDTKKEYFLFKCSEKNILHIILKDYIYKINPDYYAFAIEATKDLEFDKENVFFSLKENNTIEKILNYQEIRKKWNKFKSKLAETEYYKAVAKQSSKAAEDIMKGGDLEFNTEENLRKTYDKNLFYHVFFNNYATETPYILKFLSQIFVNIELELKLSHTKKETENFLQYNTVGVLQKEGLNMKLLEEQYNKFYKPVISYGFTDYDYEYHIVRNINKKTGFLSDARAVLRETIKNNYQIITQFDLRQVEL